MTMQLRRTDLPRSGRDRPGGGCAVGAFRRRAPSPYPDIVSQRPRVRSPPSGPDAALRRHVRLDRGRHQAGRDQHQHQVQDGGATGPDAVRGVLRRGVLPWSVLRRGARAIPRSLGPGSSSIRPALRLTNAHGVDKATEIEVVTLDGGKHRAKVIWRGQEDRPRRAQARRREGRVYARLGDSDRVQRRLGPAVGSPFGSSTRSPPASSAPSSAARPGALRRFSPDGRRHQSRQLRWPPVNMQGEVVGINTAIVAGGSGIGFAIPSNMARKIYTELRDKGRVTRPARRLDPAADPRARASFGSKDAKGVLDQRGHAGQPGRKSGLPRATSCSSSADA